MHERRQRTKTSRLRPRQKRRRGRRGLWRWQAWRGPHGAGRQGRRQGRVRRPRKLSPSTTARSRSATARRFSAPRAGSASSCRICATRRSPATGPTAIAASAWSRSRASACWRQAASAIPSPGMKVKTQTDRAKTARKMVAELLVTDQPAIGDRARSRIPSSGRP